jgi:uncharacterized protein with von Willebrand factor type A (vWA) domain
MRGELLGFVHALRQAGIPVPTGQILGFDHAVALVAPTDLEDLYWTGRATLVSDPAHLDLYDRVFRAYFHGGPALRFLVHGEPPRPPRVEVVARRRRDTTGREDDDGLAGLRASDVEALRHRRFDLASDDELRAMRRLMARIQLVVPERVTRRSKGVRRGRIPDLRRSVRAATRSDGELVRRLWRRRRRRPRPLVLVIDVSGSMKGFGRALLQFAFAARRQPGPVEVFCFGTRLTRITDDLADRDADRALAAAAERVVDWEGGTRIGESLAVLNRVHGRLGRLRGAVVVVCSDGLERGDPAVLGHEIARLARYAYRVVWVNPLKGDPRYAPIQQGMQAALPYVDRLVSGHDLASLDDLSVVLAELA